MNVASLVSSSDADRLSGGYGRAPFAVPAGGNAVYPRASGLPPTLAHAQQGAVPFPASGRPGTSVESFHPAQRGGVPMAFYPSYSMATGPSYHPVPVASHGGDTPMAQAPALAPSARGAAVANGAGGAGAGGAAPNDDEFSDESDGPPGTDHARVVHKERERKRRRVLATHLDNLRAAVAPVRRSGRVSKTALIAQAVGLIRNLQGELSAAQSRATEAEEALRHAQARIAALTDELAQSRGELPPHEPMLNGGARVAAMAIEGPMQGIDHGEAVMMRNPPTHWQQGPAPWQMEAALTAAAAEKSRTSRRSLAAK